MTTQHDLPEIPMYQPGDMKVFPIVLTHDEWMTLAARAVDSPHTLIEYVNNIIRDAANAPA